jgi:uncharacterized protein (DUF952 family)
MKIFHIVNKDDWAASKSGDVYHPESLDKEGFIHCSKADQVLLVAHSFFKGQNNLVILRIDMDKIQPEVKIEIPAEAPWSEILYPHIYGELNLDSVEAVIHFPLEEDGSFKIPDDLL